jgi:DNA mismatch repair protein MutL
VRDQGRDAAEVEHRLLLDHAIERPAELSLREVVAVSHDERDASTRRTERSEPADHLPLKVRQEAIHPEPSHEQITEDEEIDRAEPSVVEERKERGIRLVAHASVSIRQDPKTLARHRTHEKSPAVDCRLSTVNSLDHAAAAECSRAVGRIERLPEDVANQIAAGEVVERPASIVKELVENALDAEATRITVEVEEGGTSLVRVIDDGTGMSNADAVLCLERHATSKLRSISDLESLSTLGFRGEAVPSIASVSRFTLTTTERGAVEGTRVFVEGGILRKAETVGAPPGTTIEVRDLFFNVPARRKFLKRAQTEMSHVSDAIVRVALARPEVAIRLTSQGRVLVDVPRSSEVDPRGRLSRILGAEVAKELYPIANDERSSTVRVRGWIGAPSLSERTTRGLYTFVNGRFVRDRTVQHASQEGYRTLLERGRYPVVVLWIELPPSRVDVNVHPQKTEVRFADTSEVHRAVTSALTRSLAAQPWVAISQTRQEHAVEVLALSRARTASAPPRRWDDRLMPSFWPAVAGEPPVPRPVKIEAPELPPPRGFASLEPVGQLFATYLVCQGADRLVLIDQHAAHERIAFERMRRQKAQGRVEVQPLLVPRTIELDPGRAAIAATSIEALAQLGLDLEPFGGSTWILKSVPAALARADLDRMLLDVLDELRDLDRAQTPIVEAMDAILSCAACHSVVRAGDRLTKEEIRALLEQMDQIDFGAHCPHGRPVFVEWSDRELAAMFHRT